MKSKIRSVILAFVLSIAAGLGGASVASADRSASVIDWDIYHTYTSALGYTCNGVSKTSVPLRWGDSSMGLIHIEQRHGQFNDFDRAATGYALAFGNIDFSEAGKHKYRARYSDRNVLVVVSTLCQSPQDNNVNGVITSYYE